MIKHFELFYLISKENHMRAYHCLDYLGNQKKGFRPGKLYKQVEWELRDEKCLDCKK